MMQYIIGKDEDDIIFIDHITYYVYIQYCHLHNSYTTKYVSSPCFPGYQYLKQ